MNFTRASQRNNFNYFTLDDLDDEFDNGTLFFVTINSNRTSDATPSVNFFTAQSGIDSLKYYNIDELFFNETIDGSLEQYVSNVEIEGAPEVGSKMNRVHVHLVISLIHGSEGSGFFKLNIDKLKDVFTTVWGIPDVYINIRAVEYNPSTRINMLNYLDIYRRSVETDYTIAPRAFFM